MFLSNVKFLSKRIMVSFIVPQIDPNNNCDFYENIYINKFKYSHCDPNNIFNLVASFSPTNYVFNKFKYSPSW